MQENSQRNYDTGGTGSLVVSQNSCCANSVPRNVEHVLTQRLGMVSQGFNPVFVLIKTIVGVHEVDELFRSVKVLCTRLTRLFAGSGCWASVGKVDIETSFARAMRCNRSSGFACHPEGPNGSSELCLSQRGEYCNE